MKKNLLWLVAGLLMSVMASAQVREAGIYVVEDADTTMIRPVAVSFADDDEDSHSFSHSFSFFRRSMKTRVSATPEFLFVYDNDAKTNNWFRVSELKSEDALSPNYIQLYPVETMLWLVKYVDCEKAPLGTSAATSTVQVIWEQLDDSTCRVRFSQPLNAGEYTLTFDYYASSSRFAHFYVWPFKVTAE